MSRKDLSKQVLWSVPPRNLYVMLLVLISVLHTHATEPHCPAIIEQYCVQLPELAFGAVPATCTSSASKAAHVCAELTASPASARINAVTPNVTATQKVNQEFVSRSSFHIPLIP
jgi:hypothetical protein